MAQQLGNRVQKVLTILEQAAQEQQIVQDRLKSLQADLERLFAEIEQFETVLYCRNAAACRLDCAVLQVLAGSSLPAKNRFLSREWMLKDGILAADGDRLVFTRDFVFDAPSPAASMILDRSANGREEWKDRKGRSMNKLSELSGRKDEVDGASEA